MTSAITTSLEEILPAVRQAGLDMRRSAVTMGEQEARYLVDLYYTMQDYRKASGNQVRALDESAEPHAVIKWSMDVFGTVEKSIKSALGSYAMNQRPGNWAMSVHGIGPVTAAGLLAHIRMEPWHCVTPGAKGRDACSQKDPKHPSPCGVRVTRTAGAVWRFAGLDPTAVWEKGQKRPWNASLKRLCWIIGDSFVKHRASPKDVYGKLYERRKEQEVRKNLAGDFADQAAATLEAKNFRDSDTRKAYEAGRLPDGRIDLRARRYAVKLFIAHYHHVAFECHFGEPPPKPYVIDHLGHTHYLGPPGWKP